MAARMFLPRTAQPLGALLLRRSLASPAPAASSSTAAVGAGATADAPPAGRARRAAKSFDDFDYDETTREGHDMIDKERDVLAFMRTVELELPRLVPIPFTPPNLEEEYLRFHTTKTWPLEEESPEPTWVTMSAPIARLPFKTPAAKHKFLLLISPDYYHAFRPAAFDRKHQFNATHENQPRSDRARHRVHKTAQELHNNAAIDESSLPPTLHSEQAPRVGGHTPANVPVQRFSGASQEWYQDYIRVDEDAQYTTSLNERSGEDKDGWFVCRSKKFGYQLQNKKWCVDLLRRLVEAANDPEDPMTDIPLDTSHITTQFMLEKRRPDGTRPSWKDMPPAWQVKEVADVRTERKRQRRQERLAARAQAQAEGGQKTSVVGQKEAEQQGASVDEQPAAPAPLTEQEAATLEPAAAAEPVEAAAAPPPASA